MELRWASGEPHEMRIKKSCTVLPGLSRLDGWFSEEQPLEGPVEYESPCALIKTHLSLSLLVGV